MILNYLDNLILQKEVTATRDGEIKNCHQHKSSKTEETCEHICEFVVGEFIKH